MKTQNVMSLILVAYLTGCAAAPIRRTRNSDPLMRVAVDGATLNSGPYARLQNALMRSRAFIVVDRGAGISAVDKEQRLEHQDYSDRFDAPEKYARISKLYGVGGIIIAKLECQPKMTWGNKQYFSCRENLTLVSAMTGQVIASSEGEADTENQIASPDWTETVNALVENYPTHFVDPSQPHQTIKYEHPQTQYREQNEKLYRKPASTEPVAEKE